jgi:hypothetical protein
MPFYIRAVHEFDLLLDHGLAIPVLWMRFAAHHELNRTRWIRKDADQVYSLVFGALLVTLGFRLHSWIATPRTRGAGPLTRAARPRPADCPSARPPPMCDSLYL